MIVVDTNVIAYCWMRGEHSATAQRVRLRDPDWHVPVLWRSELLSVLAGHLWQGSTNVERASAILASARAALSGREHLVDSTAVLELVAQRRLSTYDCEFVALAQSLAAPLVTEDRAVLKAFPDRCLTMEAFLAGGNAEPPPQAHAPRGRYRVRNSRRL